MGHWYVVDFDGRRVVEYAPDGSFVNQFNGADATDGALVNPWAVAVDVHGRVYVTDVAKKVVRRFSAEGEYQLQWGSQGSDLGEFLNPFGIAVRNLDGGDVQVFVSDLQVKRIQRFSADGTDAIEFGSGDLNQPQGLAYNPLSDQLVVADTGDSLIRKYGPDGVPGGSVGQPGSGLGQLSAPIAVAVDSAQRIYVADMGNGRIQRFGWNGGQPVLAWDGAGSAGGKFAYVGGVAVDSEQGVVLALDTSVGRLRRFGLDGAPLADLRRIGVAKGEFVWPSHLAVDGNGRVFVVDVGNHRIQRFAPGSVVPDLIWGSQGAKPGQFNNPSGVAVDGQGRVYVADNGNRRIQRFPAGSSAPDFVWGGTQAFGKPSGVAVDRHGRVYVTDAENHRIQRFPAGSGVPDKTWGSEGPGDGQFQSPTGVAVDARDRVYVADWGNDRIQRFPANSATPDKLWGAHGDGPTEFRGTADVAVDGQGRVVVADHFNDRLQRFTADGAFIDRVGGFGLGIGGGVFNRVGGVAVNQLTGTIYAANVYAGRVNVFDYRPQPQCADGKDNDGDGRVDHPSDLGCTAPADGDETGPVEPPANREPDSRIVFPKRTVKRSKLTRFIARANDPDGKADLAKVRFALVRKVGRGKRARCYQLRNVRRYKPVPAKHGTCPRRWLEAKGTSRATLRIKRRLPVGRGYTLYSRAFDRHGHAETRFSKNDRNELSLRIRR